VHEDLVLACDGPTLAVAMSDYEAKLRFFMYADCCDACIFGRLAPS
jgi:hypothetical protein